MKSSLFHFFRSFSALLALLVVKPVNLGIWVIMPVTRSMTRAGAASLSATSEHLGVKKTRALRKDSRNVASKNPVIVKTENEIVVSSSTVSTSAFPEEIVTKNRMLLLRLEQDGVLAPGIVTIDSSGEIRADLSARPDPGTMLGLFPNVTASPGVEEQIPSWLRDYLVKELNVLGHGPPKAVQVLYEGMKRSEAEPGINTSVWLTEMQLSCAVVSLQHAIDDIRDFVSSGITIEDTNEKEFGMIIRTVLHLVGCKVEKVPKDIQLLFDIGSVGVTMKGALDEPLTRLIITPYSRLVAKMEVVAKALRQDLQRTQQQKDEETRDGDMESNADSGVDVCLWPLISGITS